MATLTYANFQNSFMSLYISLVCGNIWKQLYNSGGISGENQWSLTDRGRSRRRRRGQRGSIGVPNLLSSSLSSCASFQTTASSTLYGFNFFFLLPSFFRCQFKDVSQFHGRRAHQSQSLFRITLAKRPASNPTTSHTPLNSTMTCKTRAVIVTKSMHYIRDSNQHVARNIYGRTQEGDSKGDQEMNTIVVVVVAVVVVVVVDGMIMRNLGYARAPNAFDCLTLPHWAVMVWCLWFLFGSERTSFPRVLRHPPHCPGTISKEYIVTYGM